MKLLLVQPGFVKPDGSVAKYRTRRGKIAPLSLLHLAGMTPPDIEVEFVDDLFEDVPFDTDADLVGMTTMAGQSPRAYQLSEEFRKRGTPVVFGGHHVTLDPEHARAHADVMVLGEAENIWDELLDDARHGALKDTYRSDAWHSLAGLPAPRYDLLDGKRQRYALYGVQATRGCPRQCSFCSINTFFNYSYRMRPVDEVIRDVAEIKKRGKRFFFVDDNLFINKDYVKELFTALKPLKVKWVCEGDIQYAADPELLELAVEAGCYSIYIGIETVSKNNIEQLNKWFNKVEEYERNFRLIRSKGLAVIASVMFGLDNDDPQVFRDTLQFLQRTKSEYLALYIFTPVPGTELARQMERENRYLTHDYKFYNGTNCVIQPKHMTPDELERGFWDTFQNFYSLKSIAKRFWYYPVNKTAYFYALMENFIYRRDVMREVHPLSGGFQLINTA